MIVLNIITDAFDAQGFLLNSGEKLDKKRCAAPTGVVIFQRRGKTDP